MQEEALADLARRCDRRRRRRYTLCLFRPELAPGRGRHRRRAAQGQVPSRRRSSSRAAADGELRGLRTLDRGLSPARRARSRRQARPGADRKVRRPCVCRGPVARRVGPARVSRRVRGRRPREAHAGRAARDAWTATARSRPASSTFELAGLAARPGLGPGDARRRPSTTRSPWSPAAIVGGQHTRLTLERGGERFEAILFRPRRRRCRRGCARRIRPEVNEWQGTVRPRADHRALVARLLMVASFGHCSNRRSVRK